MKPVPFAELQRLAVERGWIHHHTVGSHYVYRKAGAPAVSIPRHGPNVTRHGPQHSPRTGRRSVVVPLVRIPAFVSIPPERP